MKLLSSTTNPFVNISINIANSSGGFDKSSFELIDFLLDNQKFKFFDINEQFLVNNNSYHQTNNNYYTNFFNTIFIMDQSYHPQLINKMVNLGLVFDPFLRNENKEVTGDILFTRTELDSKRNIFLFNLYLKQHGIEKFTQNIVEHNTLNKCISQNKLEVAEFLLEHVSINLANKNLETPIMYARNLDSLNFLTKYNPNWSQKNILEQDCSYFFSRITDDDIKKDMLNFYLQEYSKSTATTGNDKQYVEQRLKETLLNLVTGDATKVELQTFLKKYKITNPDSIINKDNRTLGHICVANEDFARFDLFPKTDIYHVDNNGYNIFVSLFSKSNFSSVTKLTKAKEILSACLEQPEKNITQETFNRLIEKPFQSYSTMSLPDWILKDHYLRSQVLKVFEISDRDIDFSSYINKSSSNTSVDNNKLYCDLLGNLMKKYDIKLLQNENIFDSLFSTRDYSQQKEHFFEKNDSEILFLMLEKCENVGKINLNEFLSDKFSHINEKLFDLKNSFMIFNKEMYESKEELTFANHQKFYTDVCKPFFEFLYNHRLLSIIEKIDEDLINQTLKIDTNGELNGFLKTFSYLKLNNKYTDKNNKTKHMKI